MKTHAQFQQGGDAAFELNGAAGGLGGAGDHLQQGAFASAVDPDDTHRFSGGNLEGHVLQHPVLVMADRRERDQPFNQSTPAGRVLFIGLAQAGDAYVSHQSSSTISPTLCRNSRRPMTKSNTLATMIGSSELQTGHWPYRKMFW
ncbi:hypothetical protein D3C71_1374130 [compost metagenome]